MLLDDCFSGPDSKNVSLILDRLFGDKGYFRKAGRSAILATNTCKYSTHGVCKWISNQIL